MIFAYPSSASNPTIVEESMPPDREHAIGTSLRDQRRTAERISNRNISAQSSSLRCSRFESKLPVFLDSKLLRVEIVGEAGVREESDGHF